MKSARPGAPAYLWFDAEFSSLDLEEAELLQVALMATDANLNRLAPPEQDVNLFIRRADDRSLSPWVKSNIPHIVAATMGPKAVDLSDAEVKICRYIDQVVGPNSTDIADRPIIAGNSVHNDWFLARKLLPSLLHRAHYRLLDVSCLKTMWTDWYNQPLPNKEEPEFIQKYFKGAALSEGMAQHDAYYDIQASAAELGFYREHLDLIEGC